MPQGQGMTWRPAARRQPKGKSFLSRCWSRAAGQWVRSEVGEGTDGQAEAPHQGKGLRLSLEAAGGQGMICNIIVGKQEAGHDRHRPGMCQTSDGLMGTPVSDFRDMLK